ncbi:MAG: polysaccharide deacetylase family protein [Paracoccaceae bacterium]
MRHIRTDILMYHSVSDRGGATAVAPDVFAMQMRILAQSGIPVLTMDGWLAARQAGSLPHRSVVITFDDGFQDFAEMAWPVLRSHGLLPIVYLPTGRVGGVEDWYGTDARPRPLMGWDTIRALTREGVLFGSHTVSHPNLNALDAAELGRELSQSRAEMTQRLGVQPRHFAAPYGLANRKVRAEIARHYDSSVSTRLGQVGAGRQAHDLPRIEMFYFSDAARWRAHLAGQGQFYLARRQALRAVKNRIMNPWRGL